MLTICIPVFNQLIQPLVTELCTQAQGLERPVEILIIDRSTREEYRERNRAVGGLAEIRFLPAEPEIGQEAARNEMAREARGEYLIMLDADCWPGADFLTRYVDSLPALVIVGGTKYPDTPPEEPDLRLHWQYGRRREASAPARRRNRFFQSNNFLVRRDILLANPFPESEAHGHSDTLWGQLLVPANIDILYIDNPVVHLGLLGNREFLARQKLAVENLRLLRKRHPTVRTRLTTFADRYPKITSLSEYMPGDALENYVLQSGNLKALDVLKLKWWISGWVPAIGYR